MARSVSYGTTWWGKNWLASLTNIDYANRIPRGRTYANTGKVFDVNILPEKGWIEACVTGMYHPFYKVRLKFEQISPEAKAAFLKDMVKDLGIVSKLTNRELDPALLDLALKHQIKLFPSSWRDLGMTCNCPDMAVPCKHIAAVIYIVSKVIDSNPFYIFSLKGIDLIKEVEALGFKLDGVTQAEASSFSDLMRSSKVSIEQMCALAQDFEMPLELVTIERTVPLDWEPDFTPNSCYDIANIVDVYTAADSYRQSQGLLPSSSASAGTYAGDADQTAKTAEAAEPTAKASKATKDSGKATKATKATKSAKAEQGAAAVSESAADFTAESQTEQLAAQANGDNQLPAGAVLADASEELDEALDSAAAIAESTDGATAQDATAKAKPTGLSKLCEAIHSIEVADFELKNRKKKPGRKSKAFLEEQAQQAAWQEKFGSVNVGQALAAIAQHRGITVFGEDEEFKVVQIPQPSEGALSGAAKASAEPATQAVAVPTSPAAAAAPAVAPTPVTKEAPAAAAAPVAPAPAAPAPKAPVDAPVAASAGTPAGTPVGTPVVTTAATPKAATPAPAADPNIVVPSGSTKVTDLLAAADSGSISVATSNKRIVIRRRS